MRKKRVLFHTNYPAAKTGFGRFAKSILSYLYSTGKYELFLYANGMSWLHPDFARFPWKTFGTLPNDPNEIEKINRDPNLAKSAAYGHYLLDKVMEEVQPDIYIGSEDIWGFDGWTRDWWNKIPCAIHTTLDSLPILPMAVDAAPKIKNYWVWSEFAQRALHKLGHHHVKCVHGCIDSKDFYRLPDDKRKALRAKFGLSPDAFIIGFVFRNQLRKSVPNLLEGYRLWKDKHPDVKNTFLLLHTHFSEGWNIARLAEQYRVPAREILCSYICRSCGEYEIKPFSKQEVGCRFCGDEKGQSTVNINVGVSEEQLCEIYNLMDVYAHPFTSGGQEIPVQEAKLTELITLVTNYSCGEDSCVKEAASIPLEWSKYTEHGTEFIKASTDPLSIAKGLNRVFRMKKEEREEWGKRARAWVIANFDIAVIGKKFEEFIDSQEVTDFKFSSNRGKKNPYIKIPTISDDTDWLVWMYKNVLAMENEGPNGEGVKYWLQQLQNGRKREEIEMYFRAVAEQEGETDPADKIKNMLSPDDKKRVIFVMPESIGDVFLSSALFESIRRRYPRPEWTFYVATKPQYKSLLDGNEFVDKVIDYIPTMDVQLVMVGAWKHPGFFDVAYLPYGTTQRFISYINEQDKSEIKCTS